MYKAIGNKIIVELRDRDSCGVRKTDGGILLTDNSVMETSHSVLQCHVLNASYNIASTYGIKEEDVVLAKKHTLQKIDGNVYAVNINDVEGIIQ